MASFKIKKYLPLQSSVFNLQSSIIIVALFATMMHGCGYHNPYASRGSDEAAPAKKLYVDIWPNRTNELGLESQLYRTLLTWLKKSKQIQTTNDRDQADYLLAGEIASINIPALAYGANEVAVEVSVNLTVRYSLTEKQTGKLFWQETSLSLDEPINVERDPTATRDNKKKALARICEDIADAINIRLINTLWR